MDVYFHLQHLKHSTRGLDAHEMTWFFKRDPSHHCSICMAMHCARRHHHLRHDRGGWARRIGEAHGSALVPTRADSNALQKYAQHVLKFGVFRSD